MYKRCALGEDRTHNLRMSHSAITAFDVFYTDYKYGALTDCATGATQIRNFTKTDIEWSQLIGIELLTMFYYITHLSILAVCLSFYQSICLYVRPVQATILNQKLLKNTHELRLWSGQQETFMRSRTKIKVKVT